MGLTFDEVANRAVARSKLSRDQLAEALGYPTTAPLHRARNPGDPGYQLPAVKVPPACLAVNDYSMLDHLCRQAGGSFVRDGLPGNVTLDMRTLPGVVGNFSKALRTMSDSLADNVITPAEAKEIQRDIRTLITDLSNIDRGLDYNPGTKGRK